MEGVHDETASWSAPREASAVRSAVPLVPGTVLSDRFRLEEHLGRGATGDVWSAVDTRVGRPVALKILHSELRDDTSRERLRREARAATRGHPNLVAIWDLHETDGLLFLSMELIEGRALREALNHEPRLPIPDVIRIGSDVAAALDHLHRQGIVHRDVKPGNIVIAPDGGARLCDLGLSRPLAAGGTVTMTEVVVGTPSYMAPEQGRGGAVSPVADVYSLGLTLAKALTGEVPLTGDSAVETLVERQRTRPSSIRRLRPECPRWLDRLIAAMLDPEARRRPSAAEVARALDRRRWRRLDVRVAGRAALACAVLGAAGLAAGPWLERAASIRRPPEVADYSVTESGSGAVLEILDRANRPIGVLRTDAPFARAQRRKLGLDLVAFGDVDGDGVREVVFGDPVADRESGLTIWRPTRSPGLERVAAFNVRTELRYDGRRFSDFRIGDVGCADLDGNGRDEIVLVLKSYPLYPAVVWILDGSGRTRTRIWHPGHLMNTLTADGDEDGRMELYAAGTCNFIADAPGQDSSPVALRLELDWASPPPEISLFGPDRRITGSVPPGVELVYADLGRVRLPGYAPAWQQAHVTRLSSAAPPVRVFVGTDFVSVTPPTGGAAKSMSLRSFVFDGLLRLISADWNVAALDSVGHSPTEPVAERLLDVRYWNGSGLQAERVTVPHS